MYRNSETGRSMVEILGVLAVIGVLSVGGVLGYRYLMNKHRANGISEQLNLRSQDISRSMQSGNNPEDFTENVNGTTLVPTSYDETAKRYDNTYVPSAEDEHFAIEVASVSSEVCKILFDTQLNPDSGIQKVQQNINGAISDLMTPADCNKADIMDLGFVYKSDLSYACDPGQYKHDGICEEAPDGYISNGAGELTECTPGTTSNSGHTKCVNCASGEKCGCEKYANGQGVCIDCVKNADCTGGDKMCTEYGMCYNCPEYADCTSEQGFTCPEGYQKTGQICCPLYANCTTDDGTLKIECSSGYYYTSDKICKKCPANAECKGGQETYTCKAGFKETESEKGKEMCCPEGATCTKVGDDFMVSCPAETYLSEKECLKCPANATCAGGDALPVCKAGFVFAEGSCQRTNCEPIELGLKCMINGGVCGYYCKNTDMNEESCAGYCQDFCSKIGKKWGKTTINYSGYGCIDPETGIYCGTTTNANYKWLCTPNENSSTPCCFAQKVGKCSEGTCTASDCDQFKSADISSEWGYFSSQSYGCIITKGSTTVYCIPKEKKWYCYFVTNPASSAAYCGSCDAASLKTGTCGNCFSNNYNKCSHWTWKEGSVDKTATWDETLQRCVGKGADGDTYSCDLSGNCYFGNTDKRCAQGCGNSTPNTCGNAVGICNKNGCPSGTEFFYSSQFSFAGCRKKYIDEKGQEAGYLLKQPGSWWTVNGCLFSPTGGSTDSNWSYCGMNGSSDLSDCLSFNAPLMTQCQQTCINGAEVKNCKCDEDKPVAEKTRHVTNGHCCLLNHTYINGACSIVGEHAGQCFYRSYTWVNETDDYKADSSSNCYCTDDTKCLSESLALIPECKATSETLTRDAQGKCKTITPTP